VAVNGKEGVEMFLSHDAGYYDVILMDIRMPVMDGLTAARKIRESHHGDCDRIPIVAMTANVFEEDVRKSFEAGMDAHLNKPVDVKQMYSLLDGIIFG
jgi:CheY-like chemotaxis protein